MNSLLILGAKSDIAKETAKIFAENGYDLLLVGRGVQKELNSFAESMGETTTQKITNYDLDILDQQSVEEFFQKLDTIPDGIISFVGVLGDQQEATRDFVVAEKFLNTNFTKIIQILDYFANQFAARESGFIIGVSSVAGERGRQSNYYYGAAKAAFTTYLSGLRNRLFKYNVHVMTVIPGYVNTKMTAGMDLPNWLTVSPYYVAKKIFKAQKKKKDIIFISNLWRLIMGVISIIPERIFKKLNL